MDAFTKEQVEQLQQIIREELNRCFGSSGVMVDGKAALPSPSSLQPPRVTDGTLEVPLDGKLRLHLVNPNQVDIRVGEMAFQTKPLGIEAVWENSLPIDLPAGGEGTAVVALGNKRGRTVAELETIREIHFSAYFWPCSDDAAKPTLLTQRIKLHYATSEEMVEAELPLAWDGVLVRGELPTKKLHFQEAVEWTLDTQIKAGNLAFKPGSEESEARLVIQFAFSPGAMLEPLEISCILRHRDSHLERACLLRLLPNVRLDFKLFRNRVIGELREIENCGLPPLPGLNLQSTIGQFEAAIKDENKLAVWVDLASNYLLIPIGKAIMRDYEEYIMKIAVGRTPYRKNYERIHESVRNMIEQLTCALSETKLVFPLLDAEFDPQVMEVAFNGSARARCIKEASGSSMKVFWVVEPGMQGKKAEVIVY